MWTLMGRGRMCTDCFITNPAGALYNDWLEFVIHRLIW